MTYLDEIKGAIAKSLESLSDIEVKGRSIKVGFDVMVTPACLSYFAKNGHGQLHLYAWTIQSFVVKEHNTIAIELVGEWQDQQGYRN